MKIYGVAILAGCFLAGQIIGNLVGIWIDVPGNMGGVAFAMFFLILLNEKMRKKGSIEVDTEKGIMFWNAMYIPIVVAMSSIQNVKAALSGGWVALVVGLLATGSCLLLVPVVSRIGGRPDETSLTRQE